MVINGDRLLHMVLADVLVHLLHSQRLPVLGNKELAISLHFGRTNINLLMFDKKKQSQSTEQNVLMKTFNDKEENGAIKQLFAICRFNHFHFML